jgi:hypothetical protein
MVSANRGMNKARRGGGNCGPVSGRAKHAQLANRLGLHRGPVWLPEDLRL